MQNQIDIVLTDKRLHLNIVDVRCFRENDSDSDHYMVPQEVTVRLSVSKRAYENLVWRDLI